MGQIHIRLRWSYLTIMIHMKLQIQVISMMSQKLRMQLNWNHKYKVTS